MTIRLKLSHFGDLHDRSCTVITFVGVSGLLSPVTSMRVAAMRISHLHFGQIKFFNLLPSLGHFGPPAFAAFEFGFELAFALASARLLSA